MSTADRMPCMHFQMWIDSLASLLKKANHFVASLPAGHVRHLPSWVFAPVVACDTELVADGGLAAHVDTPISLFANYHCDWVLGLGVLDRHRAVCTSFCLCVACKVYRPVDCSHAPYLMTLATCHLQQELSDRRLRPARGMDL